MNKHIDLIDEDSMKQLVTTFEIDIDQKLCNDQKQLNIGNTMIYFPYKPYDVQKQYMESVIQILDKGQNGLLESPTGTGKTLCLLCSSMGWLQKHRKEQQKSYLNRNLKIIYASRTHAQLKQVAQELKKTVYRPKLSMIGSRDQYCLLNINIKGNQLIQTCRNLVKREKCQFYSIDYCKIIASQNSKLITTLEESKQFGYTNKICPYYFEKERLTNVDLILLPYNYLLDDEFSKVVDVNNSIIIFDEAHNVPSTAENGQSFFINDKIVEEAKKELEGWLKQLNTEIVLYQSFQSSQKITNINEYEQIAQTIGVFSKFLENLQTTYFDAKSSKEQCKVFETQQIFNFLFEHTSINKKGTTTLFSNGINKNNLSEYISFCNAIIDFMTQVSPLEGFNFQSWIKFLNKLYNLMLNNNELNKINEQQKYFDFYKFAIIKNTQNQISLNIWCLDPSLAFKKLMQNKIHSIILTSGTLSPMKSWQNELKIEFQIKLNNKHVVDIINNVRAFQHLQYEFSYNKRKDDNQIKDLGQSILNVSQIIKGGIIVVFSSYSLMQVIQKRWWEQQLIQQLSKVKKCFWEEQGSASIHNTLEVFKKNVQRGAILFAVHRGKVAEGIDLPDDLCRAVFLIGIPYPSCNDQKIKLKQDYLNNLRQGLSGRDWYNQQAIRATNQAIGRVIRHIDDYGAIFLFDKRFDESNIKTAISQWVQPAIKPWNNDNAIIQNLKLFFQRQNQVNNLFIQNLQISQQQERRNYQQTFQQIQQQSIPKQITQSIAIQPSHIDQVKIQQKPKIKQKNKLYQNIKIIIQNKGLYQINFKLKNLRIYLINKQINSLIKSK
ncbi:unnamed protein product [Paramecium sonneborni]|uniref:Helicase ATP-binding domain-containing protein n=1 Tax=Paramecium sonneborni TaxID=65129 RepID=A0A8S1MWK3_9CILI|nr:unnamed protein product [Paramecium sonneborni]